MEWLLFQNISFSQDSSIGHLCKIDRQGIYYDTYEIQATKWFLFVSNKVSALNNEKNIIWMFRNVPEFCSRDSQ